jgi:hypothetical protein
MLAGVTALPRVGNKRLLICPQNQICGFFVGIRPLIRAFLSTIGDGRFLWIGRTHTHSNDAGRLPNPLLIRARWHRDVTNHRIPTRTIRLKPETGFEPVTPCLQDRCSGQLSYSGVTGPSYSGCHGCRPALGSSPSSSSTSDHRNGSLIHQRDLDPPEPRPPIRCNANRSCGYFNAWIRIEPTRTGTAGAREWLPGARR